MAETKPDSTPPTDVGLIPDPFAFPPETRGRFLMLATAALILAYSLASYVIYVPNLYTQVGAIPPEVGEVVNQFIERGPQELRFADLGTIIDSPSTNIFLSLLAYHGLRIGLTVILLVTVVGGAMALYILHPRLLRRHHGSRELTEDEAPTVLRDLRGFAEAAGLSPGVRFECKSGMLDGVAFGRRNREVLVLSALFGQPRFLEQTWGPVGQAIALHELAHVVNGDIRNREMARALWIALLAVLALLAGAIVLVSIFKGHLQVPLFYDTRFLVSPGALSSRGELLILLARFAGLLLVVWWIWAELIRAREFHADARVASWNMAEPLMDRLDLPEGQPPWWKRLQRAVFSHHPSNRQRLETLRDPLGLFTVSPTIAFLTGGLLAILFAHMVPLGTDFTFLAGAVLSVLFLFVGPAAILVYVVVGFSVMSVLTYLITSALGVQVQREAAADLVSHRHDDWGYLRLGRLAFLFALGLEAGLLVTPLSSMTAFRVSLALPAWLAGFTCLIWIWLVYLRAMVRLELGARLGAAVPLGTQRVLSLVSTVLLCVLFWPALAARGAIHLAENQELLRALTPHGTDPQIGFAYIFVMSSLILFVFALLFYLLVAGLSIAIAGIRLAARRVCCPLCGESTPYKIVVGRRCGACESHLAPWIQLRPMALSGGPP